MVKATKPGDAVSEDKHDVAELQFPSDEGADGVENAQRSDAVDEESSSFYVKEFVIFSPFPGYSVNHDDNERATLQEAIQNGVHPKADATFVGEELHADGVSKVFTYQVEVVPAHVDEDTNSTVTPTWDQSDVEDQK